MSVPTIGIIVEQRDASVIEQWDLTAGVYRRYDCGVLVEERPFTEAELASVAEQTADAVRQSNTVALLARARTAFTTNAAYLAKVTAGAATNADHIAQVPALTRQMQGVIRLIVGSDLLDATDDTTTQASASIQTRVGG
ncbi:hypothetical protein [Streptomyces sp. 3214.6]|uniref:hypothetical protein n=1 Tax=Streptomyces sp. 3214.6 TaxID=1882757 RepID=UPI00090C1023|nr:hypothetical protein [Streptomyces sp. 3214.6]SHI68712.1 hypothetical protein SAMN05444521_8238 [Streptomyces sp. 3214.6]